MIRYRAVIGVSVLVTTMIATIRSVRPATLQPPPEVVHVLLTQEIHYFQNESDNVVDRLNSELQAGRVSLGFTAAYGYLPALLNQLKVNTSSQIAVFSKTSEQAHLISPESPRVIYFNDSIALAWVPGGFIEAAYQTPRGGVVFYTLDQRQTTLPVIRRRDDCLACHDTAGTLDVPGMLAESHVVDHDGFVIVSCGQHHEDHGTPFANRWGGWFVTAAPEGTMANAVVRGGDCTRLTPLSRTDMDSRYLTESSDASAMMVFDHQMRLMNMLTRAGWRVRLDQSRGSQPANTIQRLASEIVDYLLFVDETPVNSERPTSSRFASDFVATGPFDKRGRSLRQLNGRQRLFRFPCSYMIYSEVFDRLPEQLKGAVYSRLAQVLSGDDDSARYQAISADDKLAIIEILKDTKPDLPSPFGRLK